MTAEFAVAMPAVLLVLATALGGVQLAGLQLRLQDAAADAARALGRAEAVSTVEHRASQQVPGAVVEVKSAPDGVVCARLSAEAGGPIGLVGIEVEATSCALDGGR